MQQVDLDENDGAASAHSSKGLKTSKVFSMQNNNNANFVCNLN